MAEEKDGVETLEKGNIYFFYRPKLEEDDPESLSAGKTAGERRMGLK